MAEETLKELTYDDKKIIVECARRDGEGNDIASSITDLKADASNLYAVKQDKLTAGTGITISNNVISSTGGYTLPVATYSTLGGIKIPSNGPLKLDNQYLISNALHPYIVGNLSNGVSQTSSGSGNGYRLYTSWTSSNTTDATRGMRICWGYLNKVSGDDTAQIVYFPLTFSSRPYVFLQQYQTSLSSTGYRNGQVVTNITTTYFTFATGRSETTAYMWFAIGV